MNTPPPLLSDQQKTDAQHLKLLAIFHYVGAGLAVLGLLFLFLHYSLMHMMFSDPKMMAGSKGGPPPAEIIALMKWFYLFGAAFLLGCGVLNLISGLSLQARKRRILSMIVAGLNCLHFPLGTTLGVFTLIVLMRDSVARLYDSSEYGDLNE